MSAGKETPCTSPLLQVPALELPPSSVQMLLRLWLSHMHGTVSLWGLVGREPVPMLAKSSCTNSCCRHWRTQG